MDIIEKKEYLNQLFDIYKNMLSEKQSTYFRMYYFEDLTFEEIGDEFNISKAAVSDSVNKVVDFLKDVEEKVKMHKLVYNIRDLCKLLEEDKISSKEFVRKIEEEI